MYRSLLNFFPKCGAYLRAELKTIVIIYANKLRGAYKPPKCGAYLSNYCNLPVTNLLHLGQNVITFGLNYI